MRIKVMHIISHLKTGGAETLITDYALYINKKKFEIVIVTLDRRNHTINEKRLKRKGIRVIFLGDKIAFPGTTNLFKKAINRIHRYILIANLYKKEKFDVVHTHLFVNNYILPLRINPEKVRLFYTVHSDTRMLFGKGKCKNRIITKYLIKYKNMIPIVLHNKMKVEVNRIFNTDKSVLLKNGINLKNYQNPKIDKQLYLDKFKINDRTLIIGHVGRFHPVKNHVFLVDLFERINSIRDSHLILVGDGELKNSIKNIVKSKGLEKNVTFLGERSDVPELMNIMDLFIFPSLHEGFGNVLIEAQAAGIKCLASNTVPKETKVTNLINYLPLDAPLETWVEYALNSKKSNQNHDEIKKYDIHLVLEKLENLYNDNLKLLE